MPNLLLVGAQKCGTSHVHQILSQSPDILGSEPKELNFFNQRDHSSAARIASYKTHFRCGEERYYLESTPHYFRLPITAADYAGPVTLDVATAIDDLISDNDRHLLVVLRNPVERALSATVHNMAKGRLANQSALDVLVDEHGILARGYYHQILTHWHFIFGDQLQVFFYDELMLSPTQFYSSITRWLGIDSAFLGNIDLLQKANSSESLAKSSALGSRPRATRDLIEQLIDLYREDIEALFADCGVSYDSWLSADDIAARWNS